MAFFLIRHSGITQRRAASRAALRFSAMCASTQAMTASHLAIMARISAARARVATL